MDAYLSALKERIGSAWESQKELLDATMAEGRSLSAEDREKLERMDTDLDELLKEKDRYQARAELVAKSDAFREEMAPRVESAREERRDPTDGEMLKDLFEGRIREFRSPFTPSNAHRNVDELRALQSEGGTVVATTFADFVSVYARTMNPVVGVARVFNTPTGEPFTIPKLTADAAGGGTVTAENAGITLADSTIGKTSLQVYKYASIQSVSTELWRNSQNLDLMDVLAETGGRQIGLNAGAAFTTGDGTDDPNGFITAGSVGATASSGTAGGQQASDTFFGPLDIVNLYYSVQVPWRSVGSWMVSNDAMAKIRTFRDANGMFLFDPGLQADMQPTLLGRPIYENPGMAAVASASKSVAFGDFKQYAIRQLPLRVDTSNEFLWGNDGVALRIIYEGDGDLIHPTAIRPLLSDDT